MSRLPSLELILTVITQTALMLVFFINPLILIPVTSEVFEFNKIILVYLMATIILFSEIARLFVQKKPVLYLPTFYTTGLIFLGALLLSTTTSIDTHVSIFGYYARFHGGLLSWTAYTIILLALIQQSPNFILNIIKISLLSGSFVAAWGFLEHWGIDASYWVQDVRSRVFSTLGQPNWLAAYLAMLIPFLFSFYLATQKRLITAGLLIVSLLFYTTFIFTYSRGGNLGLAAALLIWLGLLGWKKIKVHKLKLISLGTGLIIITTLFASSLTPRIFGAAPHHTVEDLQAGDQTATTRLIVWQGSLNIFLHQPLLGTGPETFGEAFYQYRPVAMNEISDFDFLFNKAHNEYLNYLATTGLVGTLSYLALLINFFILAFKIHRKTGAILIAASISSVAGYLIQNVFGFTVIPLAVLFILSLALIGIENKKHIPLKLPNLKPCFLSLFMLPTALAIIWITNLWRADVAYTRGLSANSQAGATKDFTVAHNLNPAEPLYTTELAYAYARTASLLPDSITAKQDADLARHYSDTAVEVSPKERTIWRIRAQTFQLLIHLEPSYENLALNAFQKAISLAPTDPRVRLELGNFYLSLGNYPAAIYAFKESIKLKPDFTETNTALASTYLDLGDKTSARKYIDIIKKTDPKSPEIWTLNERIAQ